MTGEGIYKGIFESALEGVLVTDEKGTILLINESGEQIFGYASGELKGKKIENLLPDTLQHAHIAHRREYNSSPEKRAMGTGYDLRGKRKDGTEFPMEISLNPLRMEGKLYITALFLDITRRKRDEAEMQQLRRNLETLVEERTRDLANAILELQETNKNLENEVALRIEAEKKTNEALQKEKELSELKSRFVAMASHEFRTPLSTVLSSSTLIAKYNGSAHEPQRSKHISRIKAAVNNLTEILDDFLSLEKLDENRMDPVYSEFDLVSVARQLAGEMEPNLSRGQKIIYDGEDGELWISSDKNMVRIILNNLLSNAVKYSGDDQEIELKIRKEKANVRISVKDSGIGIPKSEQKHLFERFFRARNATNLQGTGLGLNIVSKYIDILGGKIEFTSIEGLGTVFNVSLPLQKKKLARL